MQTNDDRPSGAPGTPGEAAGGSVRKHGTWPNVRDIVATTIHNHPKDCVFKSGAIDRATMNIFNAAPAPESLIDVIECAIRDEELYCPHEGINRLPNIEE